MKILSFLILISTVVCGQTIKEMKATSIIPLDLSNEKAAAFAANRKLFDAISERVSNGTDPENLNAQEKKIWNETDETMSDYWDILGDGCSWYCGGGPDSIAASSSLAAQGAVDYKARNAHDLSFKTAWVEGVAGYGVGESLKYWFAPDSSIPQEIVVVNGYVKSERAYLDNSRVKKLKVYVNDKPSAVLLLDDRRSKQVFPFAALDKKGHWTLKFEIVDVYKGLKYDDVAITDIYFDGPSH